MTYDPHTAPTHWRSVARPITTKAAVQGRQIDRVRALRLALLLGLIGFWAMVFMALF
ncbi:MAG: hypothetical protein AAFQ64_10505 [Pseudomonadota bacterium]